MFSTLMYHEIRKKDEFNPEHPYHIEVKQGYEDILPSPLFVTLEYFQEQMTYLYEQQYHTLTLEEVKEYFLQKKAIPEKSVLLTFDDCFQSVKKYAYPILKKFQFHATAFVVSNWLLDAPKAFRPEKSVCMAAEELSDIADVFEFANHTHSFHRRTSQTESMLMTAKDEEISKDLDRCNENPDIHHKDVFAYPFGLYIESNLSLLRKKGFQLAFTSQPGFNDEDTNPLLLKRNAVPYFLDLEAFQNIIGSNNRF